ncbi:hypothetical protein NECAME_05117 [Necator americanus]|uniref:GSKIP domain-containing protein n=1 Tax=Necator americanus TaxID=51031 RepID=W2SJJ0_NECAM|nr:hypothetical protein NECAME_05117 [Necator americanus]ETN69794.1 hypothetical protein NECAME_05117 [Necator americanus]
MTNTTSNNESNTYSQLASTKTPPTTPVIPPVSVVRNGNPVLCDCDVRSQLEEEAIAAVREFSYAVHSVCISEMLPRTSELLFLNLTTLEQVTYCIELTGEFWKRLANCKQSSRLYEWRFPTTAYAYKVLRIAESAARYGIAVLSAAIRRSAYRQAENSAKREELSGDYRLVFALLM